MLASKSWRFPFFIVVAATILWLDELRHSQIFLKPQSQSSSKMLIVWPLSSVEELASASGLLSDTSIVEILCNSHQINDLCKKPRAHR
jgi:hypothetical protein